MTSVRNWGLVYICMYIQKEHQQSKHVEIHKMIMVNPSLDQSNLSQIPIKYSITFINCVFLEDYRMLFGKHNNRIVMEILLITLKLLKIMSSFVTTLNLMLIPIR